MTNMKYYSIKELARIFEMKEPTLRRKVKKYLPQNEQYIARKKIEGVKQLVTVISEDGFNLLDARISGEELGFDPFHPPLYIDLQGILNELELKKSQKEEEIATLKSLFKKMDTDKSKYELLTEILKKTEQLVDLLKEESGYEAQLTAEMAKSDNKESKQ